MDSHFASSIASLILELSLLVEDSLTLQSPYQCLYFSTTVPLETERLRLISSFPHFLISSFPSPQKARSCRCQP